MVLWYFFFFFFSLLLIIIKLAYLYGKHDSHVTITIPEAVTNDIRKGNRVWRTRDVDASRVLHDGHVTVREPQRQIAHHHHHRTANHTDNSARLGDIVRPYVFFLFVFFHFTDCQCHFRYYSSPLSLSQTRCGMVLFNATVAGN
jgi:hypothetical protein